MDDLTRFKQLVKEAVAEKSPNKVQLVDSVPEKAWEEYYRLIKSYNGGANSSNGWGETIRCGMIDEGVEPDTAYILSCIRSDIKFKESQTKS